MSDDFAKTGKMLTHNEARLLAFLEIRRSNGNRSGPNELVILDEHTLERPWGWVFFYTTRGWRDGDMRYAVAGNAPIIVNRHDGSLRDTGTSYAIEHYIAEYEAELERRHGVWELFLTKQPDATLSVVRRLRDSLRLSVVEVGALRKRMPCAVQAGSWLDLEPIHARLVAAGIAAELRRSAHSP